MNRNDLYEGIGHIDDNILERSEKHKAGHGRKRARIMEALAAALVVALIGGGIIHRGSGAPSNHTFVKSAYAVEEAEYPEMAPYPDENSPTFEKDYEAWEKSVDAQKQEEGYADGLDPFFRKSMPCFLSGAEGENLVYSPLSVYMALGMLAELTEGNSRQQILNLLGAGGIEALRAQARAVWNASYRSDGLVDSVLGSSLWLSEDVPFVPSTMKTLADTYYASSYRGKMGSEEFNEALQAWLNKETKGLLKDQAKNIEMDSDTVLALASTIYFKANWAEEFDKNKTRPDTFHGASGDITCDFMHRSESTTYYRGNRFSAVGRQVGDAWTMWLLLPDKGVTAEELAEDDQSAEFLLSKGSWDNSKYLNVNISVPKFDVASQMDLIDGLKTLGVTDVFDSSVSDFTPMTSAMDGLLYVSKAQHDGRVAVDEKSVTAAAYTVMMIEKTAQMMEEKVDFILDRPFLFAITSNDGLPLFVGIVNRP